MKNLSRRLWGVYFFQENSNWVFDVTDLEDVLNLFKNNLKTLEEERKNK